MHRESAGACCLAFGDRQLRQTASHSNIAPARFERFITIAGSSAFWSVGTHAPPTTRSAPIVSGLDEDLRSACRARSRPYPCERYERRPKGTSERVRAVHHIGEEIMQDQRGSGADMGIMFSLRLAMIQIEPVMTRKTISMP